MKINKCITAHGKKVMLTAVSLICCSAIAKSASPAQEDNNSCYQQEKAFINLMVTKYHFNRNSLSNLIYKIQFSSKIIEQMNQPAEKWPWYKYKELFVSDKYIKAGVVFWMNHQKILRKAEKQYGVPQSIIVAIIGIESFYGQYKGTYPELVSLGTLAFDYPRRAKYFQSELAQYLLLARKLNIDPRQPKGSYAGALGYPQFMPSACEHYALGNILTNTNDALVSIANFLKKSGWHKNEPIAIPIKIIDKSMPANLIELQAKNGKRYWLALHNFHVIMRYNVNTHYAMAVFQLAEKIKYLREHM